MSFIFVDFRRFFKLEPTTIRVFDIKIEDTEKTRGPTVNYQPYLDITRRAAYFAREAREVRKLEILSRFETNRPSERARRKGLSEAREGTKERRKNVEEVVTLAENCDCPVKLRVLYFFFFFFSFFILVACRNLRAQPLLDNNVGVTAHVAEGIHTRMGRMRGEEETYSSDSHARWADNTVDSKRIHLD